MYSMVSLRTRELPDRALSQRHGIDVSPAFFQVALVRGDVDEVGAASSLETSTREEGTFVRDGVPVARWERYRELLNREGVHTQVLSSLSELIEQRRRGQTWVVALDPEGLSLDQLALLAELQRTECALAAPIRFIALCSHSTSPAKLCRVFQAGAYLTEKNVTPYALLRLCRLASQGMNAPLVRFSEQAGLSGAERHAFFAECAGLSKCEAADELGCSPRTLETYWSRIFAKLRIRSTDGVVAAALRFAMLET
jgi:DNA-binding NarL/FixJ family response regulator